MDARTRKLMHKRLAKSTAAKLVAAGLDTPKKIKAASNTTILKIAGIGQAAVDDIRSKVG